MTLMVTLSFHFKLLLLYAGYTLFHVAENDENNCFFKQKRDKFQGNTKQDKTAYIVYPACSLFRQTGLYSSPLINAAPMFEQKQPR